MIGTPFNPCCIEGCHKVITDKHHEPPRPYLKKEHKDDPRFKKYLCRFHHRQRTDYGYRRFKVMYPDYDGMSLEDYRKLLQGLPKRS